MAKPVEGYLADDGNFFISEAEADLHNAEMTIRAYCVSHTPQPIDADRVIEIIEALADPIRDYLHAKDRQENTVESLEELLNSSRESAEVEEDQIDEDESRIDAEPVLEQSIDGHEPMPDMGDSPQSESVQHEREGDGTRSRKRNARGFRSGKDLATK